MRQKIIIVSLLGYILAILAGCSSGGGSNGNAEPGDETGPDGVWHGSVTINSINYDDAVAVIHENYLIAYSESAGELLEGPLTINDSSISGVLTQYQLTGTLVGNSSFSGSFDHQSSVSLTSGTGISFTLSYNNLHQRSATFANLAGTWIYTNATYALTITIRADGSFNASDNGGCLFEGSYFIPASNRNIYEISYNTSNCGAANGAYSGLVVLDDGTGTNDVMHIAASNTNYAFAGSAQKQGGLPLIIRSTNELRSIEDGDYLEYDVVGQAILSTGANPVSITGRLRIEWFADTIPAPFNQPVNIPVLREVSTLEFDSGFVPATTVRYIQQDTDGLMLLAALDSNEYFWATHESAALDDLQAVYYLPSPVSPGGFGIANYKYLNGCNSGIACAGTAMLVQESRTFIGNLDITTGLGRFDALRIDYDGYSEALQMLFSSALDIRGSCDASIVTFFGTIYVFPEVGIVSLENICSANDGTGYSIVANISDTNIAIP